MILPNSATKAGLIARAVIEGRLPRARVLDLPQPDRRLVLDAIIRLGRAKADRLAARDKKRKHAKVARRRNRG